MISTIKESTLKEKPKYPCLMRSRNTGLIVLFSRACNGVVVYPDSFSPLGYASNQWGMDCFEPFLGSVTLANRDAQ